MLIVERIVDGVREARDDWPRLGPPRSSTENVAKLRWARRRPR